MLVQFYETKQKNNPSFSLRAYAKFLGLSPSTLHGAMKNGKGLSDSALTSVGARLMLSRTEVAYFRNLVRSNRMRNTKRKASALRQAAKYDTRYDLLSEEQFSSVSSWYCFAVMELAKLPTFKNDPRWIAKKLGITAKQAKGAIQALAILGILEEKEDGSITTVRDFVALPSGPPLPAARGFHAQFAEKARKAMVEQPKGTRNFSTLVLKFRRSDIERVDEKIRVFRREFSQEFESGIEHDTVYALAVQFFRLDREES